MKTIKQVADHYGVSYMAVRNWVKDGLPYTVQKVVGLKPRMMLDMDDVGEYLESKQSTSKKTKEGT